MFERDFTGADYALEPPDEFEADSDIDTTPINASVHYKCGCMIEESLIVETLHHPPYYFEGDNVFCYHECNSCFQGRKVSE